MSKGKIAGILAAIVFIIISCFSFMGSGGWTDEECYDAYSSLWFIFAHEPSGIDWFTVPDFWSGSHGNPTFRGRLVDGEFLLSGLEENCGHLYSFEYGGAATIVRERDSSSSWFSNATPAYAWALAVPVLLLIAFIGLSRGRAPKFA